MKRDLNVFALLNELISNSSLSERTAMLNLRSAFNKLNQLSITARYESLDRFTQEYKMEQDNIENWISPIIATC
ncbi:hypothetical protein [Candidatus Harpocratesius sp.]